MNTYPQRLYHKTPPWVPDVSIFHVRIRCQPQNPFSLTDPSISREVLLSVGDYSQRGQWSCPLCVLMPDHVHALLSFGREKGMSSVIREWKRARRKFQCIIWQENYFDHRIRNAAEYSEKYAYIERNPVALGLCARPEDWPHRASCLAPDALPHF